MSDLVVFGAAGNTVMIGDLLDRDVFLAQEAGIQAIHAVYGSFETFRPVAVRDVEEIWRRSQRI